MSSADTAPSARPSFFFSGRWHGLRRLPAPRAAAGAAVVGQRLYVVGGVVAPGRLAPRMLVLDLRTGRWSFAPGPSPREHLAVTAAGGMVYALAGRSGGMNFTTFEAYSPARRNWRPLPPVPYPRGGTGAAVVGRRIISVGGEESAGTIPPAKVFVLGVGVAGRVYPTCGRRGTDSRWPRSAAASTRSPAGRSRGCTSARRTSF